MFHLTGLSCRDICVVIYQIRNNFLIIFDCQTKVSSYFSYLGCLLKVVWILRKNELYRLGKMFSFSTAQITEAEIH